MEGGLDLPEPDDVSYGIVLVGGWAVSHAGTIAGIHVLLDRQPLGDAPYGWKRPDVTAARTHLREVACGFNAHFYVDTSRGGHGRKKISVNIEDSDGNLLAYERWITLVPQTPERLAASHQPVEVDIEEFMTRVQAEIDLHA